MNDPQVQASIAPWMAVSDGAKAVEYYGNALGAVERYRLEDDHGRVAVARLEVGGAAFWVQEDVDGSPKPGGARPIRIIVSVEDPDALFGRAIAAGAKQVAPVTEEHGWRAGRVTDPFGHDWEFARPVTT